MSKAGPARILFFLDDTRVTDSQRALLALMRSLDAERYPFRVLTPSYEGEMAEALRDAHIEFDAIPLPDRLWASSGSGFFARARGFAVGLVQLAGYYRKLARYHRMFPFEVVHASGMVSNLLSIGIKMRFDTPLIWQLWSVLPAGVRSWAFQCTVTLFSDHVVACSQSAAHRMGRHIRWRDRVVIAYRGYDPKDFGKSSKRSVPRMLAVTAGRLFPWKGHKTFLRAVELVKRQVAEFRAVIYVTRAADLRTPYYEELLKLVQDLKLDGSVLFECVEDGFADGSVAETLRSEGVGIFVDSGVEPDAFECAVAESMGEGVPVIASRSGVLSEMILHETTGLLVTPGDANVLADAILRLMGDESLCLALIEAAKVEFASRFGIDRCRKTIEELYDEFFESDAPEDSSKQKKAA